MNPVLIKLPAAIIAATMYLFTLTPLGYVTQEPANPGANPEINQKYEEENKMNNVTNLSGTEIDFESAVQYMDDDIREELHSELAPCAEQEFFTAYENAHIKKHGERWFLSETNPSW